MCQGEQFTNPQIVFPGPGQVIVEEAEMRPIGPRELRLQTRCSLISAGTEGAGLRGEKWQHTDGRVLPSYPVFSPGYANAGVVVEIGRELEAFRIGDRVANNAGHVRYPVRGDSSRLPLHIPEAVGFDEATFTTLSATVLNGVRPGRPQLGEAVAVVGLGVLGQLACQYLKLSGARPLIAIDLDDARLELASRVSGASHVLNPNSTDVVAAVRDLTEGRGADIVYEVTGLTQTFDLTFDLAREHGRVVALGSPRWPASVGMLQFHLKNLELIGAHVSSHPAEGDKVNRWIQQANATLFLELVAEGAMNVKDLITHRFRYQEAAEAYATALGDKGPALGVIFEWPDDE